ncbi:MAG: class E sortase [Nocardioidaceae bacterium]|nr:class E sortase [Nocardioidaceae bacterium]
MSTLEQPRTVVRREPVLGAPPPARTWTEAQLGIARAFLVVGVVTVWVLVYVLVLSAFEANHAQHRLYGELRTQLALGTVPTGAPIAGGAPVALLDAPRAGIDDLVVVEGTSATELQQGPGHLRGTVLPGQQGVSVLLGRALSYGGPFGGLGKLRTGDRITVTTSQGRFSYAVTGARRGGDPAPAAPEAGSGRLSLVTALSGNRLGRLAPTDPVYVDATLVGKAAAPGPVSTKVDDEQPLDSRVTTGTLAELVLALQLLVGTLLGAAWARSRWTPLAAWLSAAPVVLAALWLVSLLTFRLLPNLA